jgi:hypothetical protein
MKKKLSQQNIQKQLLQLSNSQTAYPTPSIDSLHSPASFFGPEINKPQQAPAMRER